MDKTKIITRYEHTLKLLTDFNLNSEPVLLPKGELFIDYGEKNHKIGILLDGLMYATYLSDSGTEWVSRFFFPPNNFIVSNHRGFVLGKDSTECIRAYEDSRLIYIEKEQFKELLDTNHKFERTVRILAEESYIQAMDRIHSFQSLNAEQRIRKFFGDYPELAQKVQRQHIASYLGIHRNILTRILYKL
ncbi:MAG: Crp/Fnr family transcriptional regulator [Draconibacterium sp.]